MKLILPFPPSVNNLWRRGGANVHLSRAYSRWIVAADAAWLVQKAPGRAPQIPGRFTATFHLTAPDKRQRDLDNFGTKAVLDWLKRAELIVDDKHLRSYWCGWDEENPLPKGGGIRIALKAV